MNPTIIRTALVGAACSALAVGGTLALTGGHGSASAAAPVAHVAQASSPAATSLAFPSPSPQGGYAGSAYVAPPPTATPAPQGGHAAPAHVAPAHAPSAPAPAPAAAPPASFGGPAPQPAGAGSSQYASPNGVILTYPTGWQVVHCASDPGADDERLLLDPGAQGCNQGGMPGIMVMWMHGDHRATRAQDVQQLGGQPPVSTTNVLLSGNLPATKDLYGSPAGTMGSSNDQALYTVYSHGYTYFILDTPNTVLDPTLVDDTAQSTWIP